jgi:flagellar assembly protein FliH
MTRSSDRPPESLSERAAERAAERMPDRTAGRPGNTYSRFIPREELNGFAAWNPGQVAGQVAHRTGSQPPPAPPPVQHRANDSAEERAAFEARRRAEIAAREAAHAEAVRQSREGGYHDGYRDGLSALENFKHSYAAQTSAQVGAVVQQLQAQLDALQRDLATRVAGIALDVARQVVRSELQADPALVVAVTQEALGALLSRAGHVSLRLNPADVDLVAEGCAGLLTERGARLVADAQVERGGCRVESDVATVDARLSTRWARACAAIGRAETPWPEPDAGLTDDLPPADGASA